jgi:hypothetical protein
MSNFFRFNRLCIPIFCVAMASASATVPDKIEPVPKIITAKIRLDEQSMIIVPVRLNGSGPYDFMLDTGCSKTMVDGELARELRLPHVGEKTVAGVFASAQMLVVQVNSLSVEGATVLGGELFDTDRPATVTSKVRGVLGEDFLRNFDLLIDNDRQVIRLESALGSMAETAGGEHLPLQLTSTRHGNPIHNRLIVSGRIEEFGDTAISLLLDSGTNQLILFKDDLGPGQSQTGPFSAGSFGQWITSSSPARRIRTLTLGSRSVTDLTVIAIARRADVDTDGLIPTSLFHSIFISHFGRFVILNPSFPKA